MRPTSCLRLAGRRTHGPGAQSRREQSIAQAIGTTTRLKALQQEYAKAPSSRATALS